MSPTFSFSRLGKLIAKQFFENAKLYLFSFIALFAMLSLVFAFWALATFPRWHEQSTYVIFLFGIFISGTIFASMTFGMLGNKAKGIYWLSIPATHSEKLLCGIFYSLIFFIVAYCTCFLLVKTTAVAIIQQYVKSHPKTTYTEMTESIFKSAAFKYFSYAFIAVQSLYVLGSVYFSRFSFILTTIVAAFFTFLFVYYFVSLSRSMFDSGAWNLLTLRRFDDDIKNGFYLYSLPPVLGNTLKYAVQFIWAPVFWVAAWFRLREKEI